MLKKAIVITIYLFLSLNLLSCNNGENTNNPNQQKPVTYNNINYEVTELNYTKSDEILKYDITFPQISGLSDNDKQKKINSILEEEALKVLKYYENPYGSVELIIDYKVVLKKENILSIQYSGVGSVSNAAHPNNLFFTTNINLETGERIRLKDVVNIDEEFADKFLNGEFKALWPEQSETLQHYTNERIQKNFMEADSLDNIGTEKQSDVFSYFTQDSLGISIGVAHAIGDHAEFEINYMDIKDNIKIDNEIWKHIFESLTEN